MNNVIPDMFLWASMAILDFAESYSAAGLVDYSLLDSPTLVMIGAQPLTRLMP